MRAYLNRGIAYYNLRHIDRTLENLNRALAFDPESAAAYFYRGIIRSNLDCVPAAMNDLQRAAEL